MEKKEFLINRRRVLLLKSGLPQVILIQPISWHETQHALQVADLIARQTNQPFVMAAFDIRDWERELTPWEDVMISRCSGVSGGGAEETLGYVFDNLLPWLQARYASWVPVILGGYSLGALFSLWASSLSDCFAAIAACSPSLWIRDWLTFAEAHPVKAQYVYLSLGEREERSKNQVMARVGDCVRTEYELLKKTLNPDHTILYWEQGGHFADVACRTARGFSWCVNRFV